MTILGQQSIEADAKLLRPYLKGTQEIVLQLNAAYQENAAFSIVTSINVCAAMINSATLYPVLQWTFFLPVGWAGKLLDFSFRWAPADNSSGNVKFSLAVLRTVEGAVLSGSSVSDSSAVIAAPGTTNLVVLSSITGLSLSSFSNGDSISLRFSRFAPDTLDTYASSIYLHSAKARVR